MLNDSKLKALKESWTRLGAEDPLWAILSDPSKKGGGWDLDEFLRSGEVEVQRLMHGVDSRNLLVSKDRALDFGCGVGRVTLALGAHFSEVHGVDISEPMVEKARELGEEVSSVHYQVLLDNRLPFESGQFDLVYSRLVLQHIPSPLALGYIGEFVRILKPNGVAIFQTPTRCLVDGVVGPSEIELPGGNAFIEMNAHSPEAIERVVQEWGGKILSVNEDRCAGEAFASHLFTVGKKA